MASHTHTNLIKGWPITWSSWECNTLRPLQSNIMSTESPNNPALSSSQHSHKVNDDNPEYANSRRSFSKSLLHSSSRKLTENSLDFTFSSRCCRSLRLCATNYKIAVRWPAATCVLAVYACVLLLQCHRCMRHSYWCECFFFLWHPWVRSGSSWNI